MIPFLTYPLALLALATLPALAAIYILRNRFRRRSVSSLVLWRFQVQSKAGGAKINRLQLPLLFFLELLVLLLLVVAATGPQWKLPQSTRPLIVVLDDSFSMRAARDGVSAQVRAKAFLENLFRQPPPSTRLILAGQEPRLLGVNSKSWREVNELLPQWQCWSPAPALAAAITLASELGKQQANILVLTDHKPASETISNPRLEWHAFGLPLDNVAFVNASRTAFGEQDRCLLEVANFSSRARSTPLLVQTGSNNVQRSLLSLGAHESQRIIFNIPATAPSLRAELGPDALAEDNAVQLLPQIRHRVRVQVSLTNETLSALVNRTLDATGLRRGGDAPVAERERTNGDEASPSPSATGRRSYDSSRPEIVIHETDAVSGSNAWSLCWSGAKVTNAFTGPFIVDASHPMASGISLAGVVWSAAAVTNSPGDVPVILAGNIPLLSVREDGLGRVHLTVNLNAELSTLQNTPDWPILFWNLLSWRISEMPGLKESNARLGAEVYLKCRGEPVTITSPDGVTKSFPKTGGELALETPVPGIYSVTLGLTTNQFAANVLTADESDLSSSTTGQWGKWSESTERRLEESSVVWIFGLLALGLLTTHLYLVATAKGGI